MSILLVRQQIDKKLDELSPEMLKAIHTLLYGGEAAVAKVEEDEIVGYTIKDEPILLKDFRKEAVKEVEDVLRGNYISADDINKNTEKWLKNTAVLSLALNRAESRIIATFPT